MRQQRKHLLLGAVVGLLTTPLVGGGVTAYLDRASLRGGSTSGALVGLVSAAVVGLGFAVLQYVSRIQPAVAGREMSDTTGALAANDVVARLWMELYLFVLLALVLGVLSGVVGGAVGSYLADRGSGERDAQPSA